MINPHDSVIVQTVSRHLIPLVQLYAVYIVFFGQYSPGGGFAAGVILGAGLVLTLLVFGVDRPEGRALRSILHYDGLGLLIFAGVGGLCLIGGGQFLNYSTLAASRGRRIGAPLARHRADADRRRDRLRGDGALHRRQPGLHLSRRRSPCLRS